MGPRFAFRTAKKCLSLTWTEWRFYSPDNRSHTEVHLICHNSQQRRYRWLTQVCTVHCHTSLSCIPYWPWLCLLLLMWCSGLASYLGIWHWRSNRGRSGPLCIHHLGQDERIQFHVKLLHPSTTCLTLCGDDRRGVLHCHLLKKYKLSYHNFQLLLYS